MGRTRLLGLAVLLAIPFAPATGRAASPSLIVFSADRGPQPTGEIFRLDPNGHRVLLDGSPAEDFDPLVSPDGKEVAFFSYRNSDGGDITEVRIDGTHPTTLVSSFSPPPQAGSLAWQPHGDRLAVVGSPGSGLIILRRGHQPEQVLAYRSDIQKPSWSPDGRVLVVASRDAWRAFTPSGRHLWTHSGPANPSCCGTSWSSHGVLAVLTRLRLRVFDENGHRRFTARGVGTGHVSPPAWSPNGRDVAFVAGGVVQVRTAKGRLVLRKRLPSLDPKKTNTVAWAGNRRVVAGLAVKGPQEGVDVRTGALSNASNTWLDPRSADGKLAIAALAIVTPYDGANFSIGVEPVGGGPVTSYGALPQCGPFSPPAGSLQFAGRSRSIVYESVCPSPYPYVYAMNPDGSDLHELTGIQAPATQPAISPDGTEIANAGSSGISVAKVDGTNSHVLATPTAKPTQCTFDRSPTWSPDGKTILYSEQTECRDDFRNPELFTVPAAGGTPHYLGVVGSDPAWGPNRIAYRGGDGELTTANPDGSDPTVVSTDALSWAWSSDGRLAYTTGAYGTTVVVGGNSVQLPFARVGSLAWSPDGMRFVVTVEPSANTLSDVFTIGTDGSDPVRLTTGYDASAATWR